MTIDSDELRDYLITRHERATKKISKRQISNHNKQLLLDGEGFHHDNRLIALSDCERLEAMRIFTT